MWRRERWWRQAERLTDISAACLRGLLAPWGPTLCTSCSQSALASLCHSLGDIPSGSDAQRPVRPADKDTVFGLALVFCRRYLALRQAWRKHFWGISAFKEKKMTCFLNTMIYVKIFLNFQKTCQVQHKNIAITQFSLSTHLQDFNLLNCNSHSFLAELVIVFHSVCSVFSDDDGMTFCFLVWYWSSQILIQFW